MEKLWEVVAPFDRGDGVICKSFLCTKRREDGEYKSKQHAQKIANDYNICFQKSGKFLAYVTEV